MLNSCNFSHPLLFNGSVSLYMLILCLWCLPISLLLASFNILQIPVRHHLPLPHTLNSLRLNSTMRACPFISWHILLKQTFNLFPSPVYQLWWGKTPCFIHLLCFLESNTIHGILIYSFWSEWLSTLLFLLNKNVPRLYEISWFQFKWIRYFTMNIWLPNIF